FRKELFISGTHGRKNCSDASFGTTNGVADPARESNRKKTDGFPESAVQAFSPLSHLPDGLVKVEGSDWCQRSEIPQKATPNPRVVSGRRANIRSGHIGSRFIIPRIGGRMKVADHLYGAHLGERRPEQQGDADFTPLDFLLFLEAVHGIAV